MFNDDNKSHTNMTSFYGKKSGVEILTCAAIDDMVSIKVPSDSNELWCIVVRFGFKVDQMIKYKRFEKLFRSFRVRKCVKIQMI